MSLWSLLRPVRADQSEHTQLFRTGASKRQILEPSVSDTWLLLIFHSIVHYSDPSSKTCKQQTETAVNCLALKTKHTAFGHGWICTLKYPTNSLHSLLTKHITNMMSFKTTQWYVLPLQSCRGKKETVLVCLPLFLLVLLESFWECKLIKMFWF